MDLCTWQFELGKFASGVQIPEDGMMQYSDSAIGTAAYLMMSPSQLILATQVYAGYLQCNVYLHMNMYIIWVF